MNDLVTAHVIVKNEDIWIWFVLQSIIDSVDKIIICNMASTDKTLDVINTIKSDKIQLINKLPDNMYKKDAYDRFTEYKNEMVNLTSTKFWVCVDGDEIYSEVAFKQMVDKLSEITEQYTVLSTRMKYFVEHLHRVSAEQITHRYAFVRTGCHNWCLGYGDEILGNPQPTREHRLSHWYERDGWEFDCFHTSFLKRSSNDSDEVYQRKHRQLRSVIGKLYNGHYGYSGPYPEVFYRKDIPEIVKQINPYIEQIYKTKEEFGM